MEAFEMAIPVAAYDIPGIDQLINQGETGLLATYGDQRKLKSYWEELLYDKEQAHRISKYARKFIESNYSAQRMANEYIDLFRRLIEQVDRPKY